MRQILRPSEQPSFQHLIATLVRQINDLTDTGTLGTRSKTDSTAVRHYTILKNGMSLQLFQTVPMPPLNNTPAQAPVHEICIHEGENELSFTFARQVNGEMLITFKEPSPPQAKHDFSLPGDPSEEQMQRWLEPLISIMSEELKKLPADLTRTAVIQLSDLGPKKE